MFVRSDSLKKSDLCHVSVKTGNESLQAGYVNTVVDLLIQTRKIPFYAGLESTSYLA